jgi:hypothetical protein
MLWATFLAIFSQTRPVILIQVISTRFCRCPQSSTKNGRYLDNDGHVVKGDHDADGVGLNDGLKESY